MIMLLYGEGRQASDWKVAEKSGPGYSRVYYINGGTSRYLDSHGVRPLRKGRLYIFPAHAPFRIETLPEDPIDCLFLHMDVFPAVAAELTEIDPGEEPCFEPILETIRGEIRHLQTMPDVERPLHYLIALTQSLFCLFRREGKLQLADGGMLEILQYIDDHYASPLTIASLSRRLGYAPEYFSRKFTRALGMSPYQYLTAHRMNRAVEMLRGPMKIGEIALSTGYSDSRAFSHAFRRRYGYSPQQFRRCFIVQA